MSSEAQTELEVRFEAELDRHISHFDGSDEHWKALQRTMKLRFPQCELLDRWEARYLDDHHGPGGTKSITFAYVCDGRERKRKYRRK